jgi:ABC-type transport system involved in multi-copper enzyme maturation permease subunit
VNAIFQIARLQFLENVRRQVHLITLFMAFVLLLLPAYVNTFSLGLSAFEIVTKDFGLTLISYYGVAMALLLGSSVVPRDIERRTIYPVLSRPITRLSYLAGQFFGTTALLWLSLQTLTFALALGVSSLSRHFDANLFWAGLGYCCECSVLVAACMCFSTIASPPLAGVLGLFLYVTGGMSDAFIDFFLREDRGATQLASMVSWLKNFVPNFEIFRLKYPVVHGLRIDPLYHPAQLAYAGGWVSLFLMLAGIRFEKRDL